MSKIPAEPEARRAYFVALGRSGGAATLEKYGTSHFSDIGKTGFAVTLDLHGGDFVWRLLRDSYLRKYPERTGPCRRTTEETREKDRLRAECRRLYLNPQPCVACGEPGTQRDHVRGVLAGNAPDSVAWRCDRCHTAKTRAERKDRWGAPDVPEQAVAC